MLITEKADSDTSNEENKEMKVEDKMNEVNDNADEQITITFNERDKITLKPLE